MSLKSPPLVEMWISFRYEPPLSGGEWTEERYARFFETISSSHPIQERLLERGLRRVKSKKGKTKTGDRLDLIEHVVAVRNLSEDGTRGIQLRPNELVVNYVRTDEEPYPGFETLLDEALIHDKSYRQCYGTAGVISAAVHYVDRVEIPVTGPGTISTDTRVR